MQRRSWFSPRGTGARRAPKAHPVRPWFVGARGATWDARPKAHPVRPWFIGARGATWDARPKTYPVRPWFIGARGAIWDARPKTYPVRPWFIRARGAIWDARPKTYPVRPWFIAARGATWDARPKTYPVRPWFIGARGATWAYVIVNGHRQEDAACAVEAVVATRISWHSHAPVKSPLCPSLLLGLVLAACGESTPPPAAPAPPAATPTPAPTPAPVATPAPPALHGALTEDIDRTADPCTDFFQFANGAWRAKNPSRRRCPSGVAGGKRARRTKSI